MISLELKELLIEAASRYETADFIPKDPVQFPHRFKTKEDIEREEREKLKSEIDEVFKIAIEDAFDTSGVDNKNIFELEQAEQRKRRIRTQQAENNGKYTQEQKNLKKKLRKMVYFVRAYSAVKVTLKAALGKELRNS